MGFFLFCFVLIYCMSEQLSLIQNVQRSRSMGESPTQFEDPIKVRKRVKIRNRYNQAPHLTQDTNEKVTTLQLDITYESQEVSPFPPGDHKALINRRAQKHNKYKTEIT